MEDKGKMDELIEQMKLMNERLGNVERMLEDSIYHQRQDRFHERVSGEATGIHGFH